MQTEIVIVGAGGFGREIYAITEALNQEVPGSWQVSGFVDDREPNLELLARLHVPFLGSTHDLSQNGEITYVVGIGSPATRREVVERLAAAGHRPAPPLVHPTAWIGPDVRLEPGVVICAGAALTTNISVGQHTHVNLGATVGHDAVLAPYVTVAPLTAISGNVVCESGVELGTGVSVVPGVTIHHGALVGAGAVVTGDLPSNCVAVGLPARPRS